MLKGYLWWRNKKKWEKIRKSLISIDMRVYVEFMIKDLVETYFNGVFYSKGCVKWCWEIKKKLIDRWVCKFMKKWWKFWPLGQMMENIGSRIILLWPIDRMMYLKNIACSLELYCSWEKLEKMKNVQIFSNFKSKKELFLQNYR